MPLAISLQCTLESKDDSCYAIVVHAEDCNTGLIYILTAIGRQQNISALHIGSMTSKHEFADLYELQWGESGISCQSLRHELEQKIGGPLCRMLDGAFAKLIRSLPAVKTSEG